jgi:hypothetical protein
MVISQNGEKFQACQIYFEISWEWIEIADRFRSPSFPRYLRKEWESKRLGIPIQESVYSSFPAAKSLISPRSAARNSYPVSSSSFTQRICW